MKILLPSNTTHIITLQPRFEPTQTLSLFLRNKVTGVTTSDDYEDELQGGLQISLGTQGVENTYTFINRVMTISFDLDVLESEQYSMIIKQGNIVMFRDLIFCTEQEPQDYKLTKDKFTYV